MQRDLLHGSTELQACATASPKHIVAVVDEPRDQQVPQRQMARRH
jgi:hypothetical protein